MRGVDLTVAAGSSLGIAGESGSGKSTLISTVLRLQPKSATVTGQVLVDGEDVLGMTFKRLRALRWAQASIVFQGALHGLNPLQRIGEQIAEPITVHEPKATRGDVDRRVGELLEQVGLPAARSRAYPHQLSGGQRQRVMIAMALACRPRLIVADEPTTALDVMVQAQVLKVLTDLVDELDLTLVLISHDLSVLADVCQRAAVMYAGRIVESGPAADVFERSAHPYSRALAGAFPRIGDASFRYAPSGLPGDPPFPGDVGDGCSFAPRCPSAREDCMTGDPASSLRWPRVGWRPAATRWPTIGRKRTGGDAMTSPALEARDLQVSFHTGRHTSARAVDGVNLTLMPGQILALVGESGCGKSTLARALLGLQPLAAGEVLVDGEALPTSRSGLKAYRRRAQLVLQDPMGSLNPRMTVYESVAEGLRIHGVDREEERVAEALSRVGMRPPERFFARYPHELSGGQRQRVVIAGALVLEPEILVADEPVSSLDASVRGEILALLLGCATSWACRS